MLQRIARIASPCAALTLCCSLGACAVFAPKFVKPALSVSGVEFTGGNLFQQNFKVTLRIENPNDRALPVSGLHADLRVGGEQVASGVSDRPFVVPALGAVSFDLTVTANMALGLARLLGSGGSQQPIGYQLDGAASLALPFLRSVPFHQSGSFAMQAGGL